MEQIQIQIIFEAHFIRIFEYLYSSLIVGTLENGSHMLSSKQNGTLDIYFMHKLDQYSNYSFNIDKKVLEYSLEQIFANTQIFVKKYHKKCGCLKIYKQKGKGANTNTNDI